MQEWSSTIADATATAKSPAAALRLRDLAPEVVDAWLQSLLHAAGDPYEPLDLPPTAPLAAAYRGLGVQLFDEAVEQLGTSTSIEGWERLRPLPTGLVREIRREARPSWRVAADLNLLLAATFRALHAAGPPLRDPKVFEASSRAIGAAAVRLVRVLDAAASRLQRERAFALLSMTEMLVHELRNRLGAAETASQMLMKPVVQAADEAWLARVSSLIGASIQDAFGALDDVRSLVSDETAPDTALTRAVSLPLLVQEVIAEVHTFAARAGVELVRTEHLAEMEVAAGPLRLILGNLVRNGVTYCDPAKDRRVVRIAAQSFGHGGLRVEVRDNGVGIAAEDLERIFSYDAGETGDGVGLGLAIARETADRLGASLEVSSEVGSGTTFTLTLPPLDG
jgi:signal transduction histidine kinase